MVVTVFPDAGYKYLTSDFWTEKDRTMETQLNLTEEVLAQIHAHGERAYPEEGAGLMLGSDDGESRVVNDIFPLTNAARRHRPS